MSVRIISADGYQVLFCSTTMQAFGPVLENEDLEMENFLEWLPQDARKYDQRELDAKFYEWLDHEKESIEEKRFDRYDGGYEGDGIFAPNH